MAVKSVLILTAAFGEGHNAAARNLADAIRRESPEAAVEVADVFAEAYGEWNKLAVRGYHLVINRLPWLWQRMFEWLHHSRTTPNQIGVFRAAAKCLGGKLTTLKPDVVVSAYPGNNFLLDHVMKKSVRRPFRTVTVVTDSITINSAWIQGHSDFWIVANEATAIVMRELGVPEAKLKTLGFPVPHVFTELAGTRSVGPPWKVLYAINAGRHLAPAIVEELLALPEVELTVTVGRDEELAAKLKAIAAAKNRDIPILGWVPNMPELIATHHLLIGKAGGATVQEALAAQTPMIITQIVPGQEEGNARLVLENEAGGFASTPAEIAELVAAIFANQGLRWQQWTESARLLGTPKGAEDSARFVLR